MSFIGANEFKCLSNSVEQSCNRYGLNVTQACGPLVRSLVNDHAVKISSIKHVILHQIPTRQGFIDYLMELFTLDGTVWVKHFQGSGLDEPVADFVLYDRQRDGVVEYLHLQH